MVDTTSAPSVDTRDPVCGMKVSCATARFITRHAGQCHYFCSNHCQNKFETDPDAYLEGRPAVEPVPEGAHFTLKLGTSLIGHDTITYQVPV